MIDLNNKDTKEYFNRLIDIEISNINASLNKQKELNVKLFVCLDKISSKISSDSHFSVLSGASSELSSISTILNKISFNFSAFAKLLDALGNIKNEISIADKKTINDIEQYNKLSSETIKKVSINVMRIEEFLAENNPAYQFGIDINNINGISQNIPSVAPTTAMKPIEHVAPVMPIVSVAPIANKHVLESETLEAPIQSIPVSDPVVNEQTATKPIDGAEILQQVDELPLDIFKYLRPENKPSSVANMTENTFFQEPVTNNEESPKTNELSEKVSAFFSNNSPDSVEETRKAPREEVPSKEQSEYKEDANIPSELVEKTLIISESDGEVVLPYTIKELEEILEENSSKYNSLEDIIDKFYTRPLKYYRHSATARFKEAYKLVRKKEGGSISEAIDLGMELFSNYSLHPAIISACKDMNELDIYLSCLEYNELDDFNFFKIIFNVTPSTKKFSNRNDNSKRSKKKDNISGKRHVA